MSNANDMAFPVEDTDMTPNNSLQTGLSKREYAAIQIAAGMGAVDESGALWSSIELAERAVGRADALLARLTAADKRGSEA